MKDENPFAGLRPVPPPGELRGRVLIAATHARAEARERAHWIDRVWESRMLRLIWSAALFGALFGHLAVERAAESAARRFHFVPPPSPESSWLSPTQVAAEAP